MTADDFDAATELAAKAVEDGCPTRTQAGKVCDACVMAAKRVRALEISSLPEQPE